MMVALRSAPASALGLCFLLSICLPILTAAADGDATVKFGGRIHSDWIWTSVDDEFAAALGDPGNGTEFRRARLFASGTYNQNIVFKAQYDFAGGDANFRDVYIGLNETPLGSILVGQQKEDFSLEGMTSSNYITFMERSLATLFNPGRNTGIQITNHLDSERLMGSIGYFRNANDFGLAVEENAAGGTARIAGTPMLKDDAHLVHAGVSATYRDAPDDTLRFSSRPTSHWFPAVIATAEIPASSRTSVDLEAAGVFGPLSVQGEYVITMLASEPLQDPTFTAFYVYASFFLTGESRPYKQTAGAFGRVKPKGEFNGKSGSKAGAWEVAARYSHLDLNDSMAEYGELDDITVGLNWYWTSHARIMFNYIRTETESSGSANSFQSRLQVDF